MFEQVLAKYPTEVKLVFKNFPLTSIHKDAMNAGAAALAAHAQGKFWEYHDKLFAEKRLTDEALVEYARQLGLNLDKFNHDRKSREIQQAVAEDGRDGMQAGVRGTPTIFINGRRLKQRSLEGFAEIIEEQLAKKK